MGAIGRMAQPTQPCRTLNTEYRTLPFTNATFTQKKTGVSPGLFIF